MRQNLKRTSVCENKWQFLSEAQILLIASTEIELLKQKHPPAFSANWIEVNEILECLNVNCWCNYNNKLMANIGIV